MQESNINSYKTTNNDDEIDILEILYILIHGKWIIAFITIVMCIFSIFYSLSLPNIYESKALLAPVNSSSKISSSLQNYSGIASLAGISLPSSSDDSNVTKALKKIKALSFFENSILPNIYLPELMAVKSWNQNDNTLQFDQNIFNEASKTWTRDVSFPYKQVPSPQESFIKFQENMSISEDLKTGFVTLKIKHQSPYVAKKWAELIVTEINSFYRQKDKLQARIAIDYLSAQMSISNFAEIKQAMAELIQQEIQKLTLIEANEAYTFNYIDPPAVMESKAEPKRAMICILGGIIGIFLGMLIVLINHFMRKN